MKNYYLFVFILFFSFLFSCSKGKDCFENGKVIPDTIYSFFPDTKKFDGDKYYTSLNICGISNDTIWFFSVSYYFIAFKFDNFREFNSTITSYNKKYIVKLEAKEDSSYFIVSRKEELQKLYPSIINLERTYKKYKNKYIIPSFHPLMLEKYGYNYDYPTICGLPKDYEILIMKSGREFVLPANLYYDWYVLPPELKHGYTSGIAYSEKDLDIIYWVIAW